MDNLWLFILLALLAEILGTVGGFGSSLFFVPIATYFLDFQSALGVTALFHLSSNISKIALFRHGVDRRLILMLGIPAVLFVIAGAWLSGSVDTRWLNFGLGGLLVLISAFFFLFSDFSLKASNTNAVVGGALSGFLAGMLGTGGAIRGLTLAAFQLKMEVFIATSAVIDLGIDLSRSVVYYEQGYVHNDLLYLIPILFMVGIIGTYLGKRILKRFSEEQFKSIVLLLIFAQGAAILISLL